jgi:serine/threonine protein kinase
MGIPPSASYSLAGGELFSLLQRGPLAEAEAARLFRDLLSGVAYLHNLNILHMDLKVNPT